MKDPTFWLLARASGLMPAGPFGLRVQHIDRVGDHSVDDFLVETAVIVGHGEGAHARASRPRIAARRRWSGSLDQPVRAASNSAMRLAVTSDLTWAGHRNS